MYKGLRVDEYVRAGVLKSETYNDQSLGPLKGHFYEKFRTIKKNFFSKRVVLSTLRDRL